MPDPVRLIVQILKPIVQKGPGTSYADLKERLKSECGRLHVPYDADVVARAMDSLEQSRRQPLVRYRLARVLKEPDPEQPIIDRTTAAIVWKSLRQQAEKRGVS